MVDFDRTGNECVVSSSGIGGGGEGGEVGGKGFRVPWQTVSGEYGMVRYNRREALTGEFGQQDSIDVPSSYDIQIDLDVPRTISGHVMFKTRYGMG